MSQYGELIDKTFGTAQQQAGISVATSIDDDPEQASRALKLGEASGVDSSAIFADVEGFDRQFKGSMAGKIIGNNPHLQDYINSHPLAAKVSNDDWGQLDKVSQAIIGMHPSLAPVHILTRAMPDIIDVAKEGLAGITSAPEKFFGTAEETEQEKSDQQKLIDFIVKQGADPGYAKVEAHLLQRRQQKGEALTGALFGPPTILASPILGAFRSFVARPIEEATGFPREAVESYAMVALAALGLAKAKGKPQEAAQQVKEVSDAIEPYLRAGKEPPVGIHPAVDKIKIDQTRTDLKALDEAMSEAQGSFTKERNPDLFANFIRQHTDAKIGVSADALRELYGNKEPHPEDNILGWLPDIKEQLRSAEATGGDVQVPLADWLARVDPAIAKELHDDIRVRPGGVTVNEGKELKEATNVMTQERSTEKGVDFLKKIAEDTTQEEIKKHLDTLRPKTFTDYLLQRTERMTPEEVLESDILWAKARELTEIRSTHQGFGIPFSQAFERLGNIIFEQHFGRKLSPEEMTTAMIQHAGVQKYWGASSGIRRQGGLEPLFQEGPAKAVRLRKLQGKELGEADKPAFIGEGQHSFALTDEKGRDVGQLLLNERHEGKDLYVEWVSGNITGGLANTFGPRLIRGILEQLKAEFPNAEFISGHRISGAREAAGAVDTKGMVRIPIKAFLEGSWEKVEAGVDSLRELQEMFGGYWHSITNVTKSLIPTEKWLEHEQELVSKVEGVLNRVIPRDVEHAPARAVLHRGRQVHGIYLQFEEDLPILLWSLTGRNERLGEVSGLHTARHEALHHLYESGFFDAKEREILQDAALNNDWVTKHGIEGRYAGASLDLKLREAIAEEFGEWERQPRSDHPVAKLFQKLKDLFDQLREAVKGVLGVEPSWQDLFRQAERGEIGQREPTSLQGLKALRQEKQGELDVTRQEDLDLFAKARDIGMTADQYRRYMKLIDKREAEDIEYQRKQAQADEARRQTKEWKENEARVREEVKNDLEGRPDIAVGNFFRDGLLYGDKLAKKPRIGTDYLTAEQKQAIPKQYLAKSGMHPDDLASLFGYQSGETMVNKLIELEQGRGGLPMKDYLKQLTDAEVAKRMKRQYGNLDENILKEAEDHVLGTTQMDLLHEETVALGMKAGSEMPFSKEDVKGWVQKEFGDSKVGSLSVDKFLSEAGKAGRATESALLKDEPAEAFKQKQRQYFATLLAREAKKLEKEMDRFDKTAKQFSKREVPSIPQEYTNFIHDILMRTGQMVRRSIQDLQEAISHGEHTTLEDFVAGKEAALREVPVAEFLFDEAFAKPVEQMTTNEFRAVHDSIKTLIKNGRDEKRIIKEGEEADLDVIRGQMVDELKTFKERKYNAADTKLDKFKHVARTYLASHLQLESLFNRWDRGDPQGVFTQYIMRGLASAANYESALERRFSRMLSAIADKANLNEKVDNPIFIDPLSRTEDNPEGALLKLTRKNLRAIIQNVGNKSNLDKLARGYQVEPQAILDWLNQHAKPEDWKWAREQGEIFAAIKAEADVMYRNLSGIEPESVEIGSLDTPQGRIRGWYHPIIYHPVWEGQSKKLMGGEALEQDNYIRATTPRGYTKQRTGYAAPLSLDLDQTPSRMKQMIHDIAFRPEVINSSKIFYNPEVRAAITKYYGKEYRDLLIPYLKDVANSANYRSDAAMVGTKVSEFFRQNIIATLIGFNPGTVMKHGPTAAINSLTEVGPINFLKAVKGLFEVNDQTGETNWKFAMTTSEELGRRHRHYVETFRGAQEQVLGTPTFRDTMIKIGSYPVAMSDLLSAVPTWLAQYEKSMRAGEPHGDAVFAADRAVRRAHGSSVVTNRPAVMRGGPMAQWFASLYGFFSHILNRQYELMWKAGDTLGLVKEGEYAQAAKKVPELTWGLFSYIIFPALIEELVSPLSNDEKESWGAKAAKGLVKGLSSSWIGIRDIAHASLTGHDPSAGLISSTYKTVSDLSRDLAKVPMNKQKAGDIIQHGTVAFGALTGLTNAQEGKTAKFVYNYTVGQEHPRGFHQWWHGIRYGTTKEPKR